MSHPCRYIVLMYAAMHTVPEEVKSTALSLSYVYTTVRPTLCLFLFSPLFYSYLKLYGYQFSKKDHVELIQLLLALVVIPDLELGIVQKLAHTLGLLLK